ncbi:MAG: glycosyltransferase family 39 protein [Candidatus Obscuribacterales bacterium]|nr:glycosyltransferase family 39 protein [Candidatus Obscuribacterales bacterium]
MSKSLVFIPVLLLCAFVIFARLGDYPLFNPDEALYAEPAREMLVIGDYVTTYLNYVVRFTKPPLVIWAMALFMKIFGVSEFAARFFGASCGLALIGVTYAFVLRYVGLFAAVIASFSLVLAPLYLGTAREAITDMPLSLFMAWAQFLFFRAMHDKTSKAAFLAWILLGLAVMTKGPVGLVVPGAIVGIYILLTGNILEKIKRLRLVAGLFIVAFIALPWFATEIYVTKGAYFNEFIMRENVERFTANVDAHKQPVWYHLLAMLIGFLPFSVYVPVLLKDGVGALKSKFKEQKDLKVLNDLDETASLRLYCAIWVLFTLAFYSISVSKLLPYTLPAFPALALLTVDCLDRHIKNNKFAPLAAPLLLIVGAMAAVGISAPKLISFIRDCPPELSPLITGFAGFAGFAAFVALALLRSNRSQAAFLFFAVAMTLGLNYYLARVLPLVSARWEGGLPELSRFAGQSTLPILVYDMRKPGVPFYSLRKVENFNNHSLFLKRLTELPKAYILARTRHRDLLLASGLKEVRSQGSFSLFVWGQN